MNKNIIVFYNYIIGFYNYIIGFLPIHKKIREIKLEIHIVLKQ